MEIMVEYNRKLPAIMSRIRLASAELDAARQALRDLDGWKHAELRKLRSPEEVAEAEHRAVMRNGGCRGT